MEQSESAVNESTQSKYRRKRNPNTDQPAIKENEVRITTQGKVKRYVDYAVRLLSGPQPKTEQDNDNENDEKANNEQENAGKNVVPSRKFDTIALKATGRAIYSAVTTAEVVKRKVANLHQMTKLDTLEMSDVWEPLEEGLQDVKTTRRVASICITLSRDKQEVESNAVGYQEPIYMENVGAIHGRGRGRGRGRGNRSGFRGNMSMENRRPYRGNGVMRGRRQDFNNNNNNNNNRDRDRERDSYPIRRPGYDRPFRHRQDREQFSRPYGSQGFNSGRQFNNRKFGQ